MHRAVRMIVIAAAVCMSTAMPNTARAESAGQVVFTGTAVITTGNALGHYCTADKTRVPQAPVFSPGTPKCPLPPFMPGGVGKLTSPFRVFGNTSGGNLASDACVGTHAVALKERKPEGVYGPACTVTAAFVITGFCNLAQITGTGRIVIGGSPVWFNFTASDVAGVLVVRGNWWFGGPVQPPVTDGDVLGTLTIIPVQPEECHLKTARAFRVLGTIALVHPKVMP